MNAKKILATIMAVVLICAISVTGTLAFLQAQTVEEVVNTFVAAGGGNLFNDGDTDDDQKTAGIVLNESKAVRDEKTGAYTLNTEEKVFSNDYIVLPGTTVAKDPAIYVEEKNDVPAYVFVEIVDASGENISWEINTVWTATGVDGPNGGTVYHLADAIVDDLEATSILKDNKIVVADEEDLGLKEDKSNSMTFYGYLAQSTVNGSTSPKDVFTACFLGND